MAVYISGKFKPNGDFPLADAEDIQMPDGTRLSETEMGKPGQPGKSAYEIAVANGFEGTEPEWLESLKGEPGAKGEQGEPGEKGEQGEKGDPGDTKLPEVTDADEGKVVQVENGEYVLKEMNVDTQTPVFNLAGGGLQAVPANGGESHLQADTAVIRAALEKGPVTFIIPIQVSSTVVVNVAATMSAITFQGAYQCISSFDFDVMSTACLTVDEAGITLAISPIAASVGLSVPGAGDDGKFLRVVDGKATWEALTDVSQEGV